MATHSFTGFPPTTLKFLTKLSGNNNRDWFAQNKDQYETGVREPALAFIEAMQKPLQKVSECFDAVPKKVGGSLMRVHRDTRFSKDKTPYKTNVGIHFRHMAGKDVHAPGFYVHIDPKEIFLGVGIWHPDSTALAAIREAIDDDPAAWKKVRDAKAFKAQFELSGDSLKRPPKGFAADHPIIDDLKRKDFIGVRQLTAASIHDVDFVKQVATNFKTASQFMQFLCRAMNLPY